MAGVLLILNSAYCADLGCLLLAAIFLVRAIESSDKNKYLSVQGYKLNLQKVKLILFT